MANPRQKLHNKPYQNFKANTNKVWENASEQVTNGFGFVSQVAQVLKANHREVWLDGINSKEHGARNKQKSQQKKLK